MNKKKRRCCCYLTKQSNKCEAATVTPRHIPDPRATSPRPVPHVPAKSIRRNTICLTLHLQLKSNLRPPLIISGNCGGLRCRRLMPAAEGGLKEGNTKVVSFLLSLVLWKKKIVYAKEDSDRQKKKKNWCIGGKSILIYILVKAPGIISIQNLVSWHEPRPALSLCWW